MSQLEHHGQARASCAVAFLGAECPLARLYGPRLQQLSEEFSSHGVQVVGVNSNPQDSPDDIKRFAKEHGVSFPVIKDHRQSLAKKFGAKRTPEVFVLDASGHVRYQGRIDDQYEPGTARPKPSRHDLRNALESLIAGRDGCRCGRKHRRSRLPVQPGDEENAARHHRPL